MWFFRREFQQRTAGNSRDDEILNNNNDDELINVSNLLNVQPFNSESTDTLKPQGKVRKEERSWEKDLIMNLNSMDKLETDDSKTSYVIDRYR